MQGKDRRWKIISLLAVGMAIGVAMTATPAVGHVSGWVHNWNRHIKPRADARYFTKAQAEARYYNVEETVANATNASNASNASNANNAANANLLDGVDSSAFLRDDVGVYTSNSASDATDSKFHTQACPTPQKVLGGGVVINSLTDVPVAVTASHPAGFGTGTPGNQWWANAEEYTANATNWSITVYAICATVTS
jgi:hypothetical protein